MKQSRFECIHARFLSRRPSVSISKPTYLSQHLKEDTGHWINKQIFFFFGRWGRNQDLKFLMICLPQLFDRIFKYLKFLIICLTTTITWYRIKNILMSSQFVLIVQLFINRNEPYIIILWISCNFVISYHNASSIIFAFVFFVA